MENVRILDEQKRLEAILDQANVPEQHREVLAPVVDNLAWMKVKLEDTRVQIKNSGVAIPYDNGGGQSGIRESPLFKGYYNLWKSYASALAIFTSYLPKEIEEEVNTETLDILTQVREMKKAKKA